MRRLPLVVSLALAATALASDDKISPWLLEQLGKGGPAELLVVLGSDGRPSLDRVLSREELYKALASSAVESQAPLLSELRARSITVRPFHIVNAVLVRGDLALARSLAARGDVARIVGNPRLPGIDGWREAASADPVRPLYVQWNLTMVRAPEVWSGLGDRGEGIVVATADTGVDWAHFALINQYRGYDQATGDADHSYAWHDAFGTYTVPYDDNSHGTHVTGIMVGDDGGSNQIGMAPGAKWIACRNMSGGYGSPSSYLDCMEWELAPYPQGGNPLTDGRPDLAPSVVNNSWGCPPLEGCDPETLHEATARLRQAGIFQTASAGNTGSACGTVDAPTAIHDETFTAAAVDSSKNVTGFSSRGPVTVDGSGRLKPDLAAPGNLVYSSIPDYRYTSKSGTSMAAPHISGAVALLWSYRPALRGHVALTECALAKSASTSVNNPLAQTCGDIPNGTFPNDVSGHGLLDAYAAATLAMTDADPAPDACDCAPADASAFAAPGAIADLRVTGSGMLQWADQGAETGSGTRYDVLRGDLAALRTDGGISGAACLAHDLATAGATDPTAPDPGAAFYYLVRSRNACGGAGWGGSGVNSACD